MKKKLKLKISAVMLSIVLVLTMVATPSAFTARDVSAEESKDTEVNVSKMNRLEKWALAMGTLENDNDKVISNDTAAMYIALCYAGKGQETVEADEFCQEIRNNFKFESFNETALANVRDNEFFSYDQTTKQVTIKKLSKKPTEECTYIGDHENTDGTRTMYGVWTDSNSAAGTKRETTYVALDLDQENTIISYRTLSSDDVDLTVDFYETDDDGNNIRSYESNGKVFIPFEQKAEVSYYITIIDRKNDQTVQFDEYDLVGNIFELSLSSDNDNIAEIYDGADAIYTGNEKGSTKITYELKSVKSGNVVFTDTLPCTVYSLSIKSGNEWGNYVLPDESREATANLEGYDGSVVYEWVVNDGIMEKSNEKTCRITAPSNPVNTKILLRVWADDGNVGTSEGTVIGETEKDLTVANCDLSFSYRKFVGDSSVEATGDTLKVGEAYWFSLDGASFAWDYENGNHTFYTLDFNLNGTSLTATDEEKNLSNDLMSIGIGAGGGYPNRIIKVNQSGTLTIKGKIYRDGKLFRETAVRTFKVEGNEVNPSEPTKPSQPATTTSTKKPTQPTVSVKTTKLKSVKNAKGKKMTIKWAKNTAGNGYQIQYSTSKKFAKGNKTKTISKNKTTSYTIKKLKKKKTYYVRIRTYKKVSGKTYYSEWSSVKKVKIKK